MQRRFVLRLLAALCAAGAATLVIRWALSGPRITCDNLPAFDVRVDGAIPDVAWHAQVGACRLIADGPGVTAPLAARPGARASVEYLTDVRWDRLTYTVRRGDEVIRQGRLHGRRPSFRLPEAPGEYAVVIQYLWGGPLSGVRGEGAAVFSVRVE
ncbi:MAG: hypothetical protein DIU55_009315 [Bacillota bacterium]|nr:MAG: hypothetical protein DIU55_04100 [Bacillota bacterium]